MMWLHCDIAANSSMLNCFGISLTSQPLQTHEKQKAFLAFHRLGGAGLWDYFAVVFGAKTRILNQSMKNFSKSWVYDGSTKHKTINILDHASS